LSVSHSSLLTHPSLSTSYTLSLHAALPIYAVELILRARGRVVVTGIGKSGHIARKLAATLASTGTPAFFVHSAEASHGDLGMITDRKSTRLNSSHVAISYAVFCLKKKTLSK